MLEMCEQIYQKNDDNSMNLLHRENLKLIKNLYEQEKTAVVYFFAYKIQLSIIICIKFSLSKKRKILCNYAF